MPVDLNKCQTKIKLSIQYLQSLCNPFTSITRKLRKRLFMLKIWNFTKPYKSQQRIQNSVLLVSRHRYSHYQRLPKVNYQHLPKVNHTRILPEQSINQHLIEKKKKKSTTKICPTRDLNQVPAPPEPNGLPTELQRQTLLAGINEIDILFEALAARLHNRIDTDSFACWLSTVNLAIIKSPGDGHCMLHSAKKCLVNASILVPEHMTEVISRHVYLNIGYYTQFFNSAEQLILLMNRYLKSKEYNNDFVDIMPLVIANTFMCNLTIFNNTIIVSKISINPTIQTIESYPKIYLYRNNDHYDSIIRKNPKRPPEEMHSNKQANDNNQSAQAKQKIVTHLPSLLLHNIASISKKHAVNLLRSELIEQQYEVAILCETHLKQKHHSQDYQIEGYNLYRLDRRDRKGGGIICYYRNEYTTEEWLPIQPRKEHHELIWIKNTMKNSEIYICAVYHPPKPIYKEDSLLKVLESNILQIRTESPQAEILIAGDINGLNVKELIEITGLTPNVKQPTRGPRLLDQVFSTEPYMNVKVMKSIVKSDHMAVIAYNQRPPKLHKARKTIHFRQSTPQQRRTFLENAQETQMEDLSNYDLQTAANIFYANCAELLNNYFPIRTTTITTKDPIGTTPTIKRLLRIKNRYMHKGQIHKANAIALKIRNIIKNKHAKHLKDTNLQEYPQDSWKKIKEILKPRNNQANHNDNLTADSLNEHYSKLSTDRDYCIPLLKATASTQRRIFSYFNETQVRKQLDKLKKTANGPDGIPYWFLKIAAPIIVRSLTQLYNISASQSKLPSQWKNASIHPIPKVSNPKSASDYRPISLTSILSRILEKLVVKNYIIPTFQFLPNKLTLTDQHAYLPSASTTTCQIALLQEITSILQTRDIAIVIALDFSKAFDTIRHSTMLEKFSQLRLDDNIYNWIADYFQNHTHRTKFQGKESTALPINSGVIQGSAIGPVAYAITASDLTTVNKPNTLIKYADDTYLILPGKHAKYRELELNNIETWARKNNLKLNKAKSTEIIFTTPRSTKTLPKPLEGIKRVETINILGVIYDSKLGVGGHIDQIITSSIATIQKLKKLLHHGLDKKSISQISNIYMKAKILYASQAWTGYAKRKDLQRLESFMKRMTKWGFGDPDSCQDLKILMNKQDKRLFEKVCKETTHKLAHLLPNAITHTYDLRPRRHNFAVRAVEQYDSANFIARMCMHQEYVQDS